MAIEVARVIDRGIRESKSLDTKKLCLIAGEKVWSISVDLCPLNDDGNLIDVGSMAAVAAIFNARFPSYENGKVDYKKKTEETIPITRTPVAITILKIGNVFVVDPTEMEEQALDARLTVTTIDDDRLCSIQKGGVGTLSIEDIEKMVELAVHKSREIRKLIKQE
jgi:exosome complex component RRP42